MKRRVPVGLEPDVLHMEESTYIFMTGVDIRAELEAVAAALPEAVSPHTTELQRDDWWGLSVRVELALPAQPPDVPAAIAVCIADALGPLPETKNGLLRQRLELGRAVLANLLVSTPDQPWGPPPAFAVSPLWNRRIANFVSGEIHPAWVAQATLPPAW